MFQKVVPCTIMSLHHSALGRVGSHTRLHARKQMSPALPQAQIFSASVHFPLVRVGVFPFSCPSTHQMSKFHASCPVQRFSVAFKPLTKDGAKLQAGVSNKREWSTLLPAPPRASPLEDALGEGHRVSLWPLQMVCTFSPLSGLQSPSVGDYLDQRMGLVNSQGFSPFHSVG